MTVISRIQLASCTYRVLVHCRKRRATMGNNFTYTILEIFAHLVIGIPKIIFKNIWNYKIDFQKWYDNFIEIDAKMRTLLFKFSIGVLFVSPSIGEVMFGADGARGKQIDSQMKQQQSLEMFIIINRWADIRGECCCASQLSEMLTRILHFRKNLHWYRKMQNVYLYQSKYVEIYVRRVPKHPYIQSIWRIFNSSYKLRQQLASECYKSSQPCL